MDKENDVSVHEYGGIVFWNTRNNSIDSDGYVVKGERWFPRPSLGDDSIKPLYKFVILVQNMAFEGPNWIPVPMLHYDKDVLTNEINSLTKIYSKRLKEHSDKSESVTGLTDLEIEVISEQSERIYNMEYANNGYKVRVDLFIDNVFKIITLDEWFEGKY